MTALQYFRILAPEYSAMSDDSVNTWIAIAEQDVYAPCLSDEELERASSLMAAHMIMLANGGGASGSGSIKSEKEGDLSRTYSGVIGDNSLMGSTGYGRQYIALTDRCFGATIMTRM